jgi:hypothetical protein
MTTGPPFTAGKEECLETGYDWMPACHPSWTLAQSASGAPG